MLSIIINLNHQLIKLPEHSLSFINVLHITEIYLELNFVRFLVLTVTPFLWYHRYHDQIIYDLDGLYLVVENVLLLTEIY